MNWRKSELRKGLILAVLVIVVTGCVDTPQSPKSTEPVQAEPPQEAPGLFYSYEVEDTYRIYVSLPEDYDTSAQKYPVIYVLDADVFFDGSHPKISGDGVKGAVSRLTERGDMPEVVLVGIGYPREDYRERDFLYPSSSACISGRGDKFYKFLKNELIPYIDAHYNTTSERTLIGWEYGGYFTLYALFEYRHSNVLFTNFVAVSPTTDYYGGYLLYKEEIMHEKVEGYLPLKLYMTADTFHMYIETVADTLHSREYTGFQFQFRVYHVLVSLDSYQEDMYTMVCPAIEDGLKWIFSENADSCHLA